MSGFLRRWWPLGLFVVTAVVLQSIVLGRYDVSGHAAGHLNSASAVFFASFLIAALFYVTPPARRQFGVVLASAAWLVTTLLITISNIRVVEALIDAGLGTTPTEGLVETSTVAAAHDLADVAYPLTILSSIALIVALYLYKHISLPVCIGAAAASVLIPPWIIPGVGVLVAVFARCVRFNRDANAAATAM